MGTKAKRGESMTRDDLKGLRNVLEDIYAALKGRIRTGIGGAYVKKAVAQLKEALELIYERLNLKDKRYRINYCHLGRSKWPSNRKQRAMSVVWALDQPIWELDNWYLLREDDLVIRDKVVAVCEHMKDAVAKLWDYDDLEL